MKKKTLFTLLVAICLISMLAAMPFLGACAPAPAPPAEGKETVVIGGVPAAWAGARMKDSLTAEVIERKTPYSVEIAEGYGYTAERFAALQDGIIDISTDIHPGGYMYEALAEMDPDLAKRFEYLALWPCSWTPMPLIVHEELPINSLTDAIEKKYPLKIGTGRSTSFKLVNEMWKACGSEKGVLALEEWGGMVDKTSGAWMMDPLLREGVINTYQCMGAPKFTQLEAIHSVRPLKCLPAVQTEEQLQRLTAEINCVGRCIMEAGYYSFLTEDIATIGILRCYIASPKLSDEVAYNLVKVIWEEREELSQGNPDFKSFTPELMKLFTAMDIGYHPGAERFYKEIGVWAR